VRWGKWLMTWKGRPSESIAADLEAASKEAGLASCPLAKVLRQPEPPGP